jgi:regulator of replication initiation timing
MNRRGESDADDPYDLIRRLRTTIEAHAQTIDQYRLVCDSLVAEKNAALAEAARLRRENEHLTKKLERSMAERERGTGERTPGAEILGRCKSTQLGVGSPSRELAGTSLSLLNAPSEVLRKREGQAR